MDLSGVLSKFGVGLDAYGIGANAGMYSWFKPYSPAERLAAARGLQASYDEFVERVATSRGLTLARVDELARGRVWSGARALELGLADRYGGLQSAISFAGMKAGLRPSAYELRAVPETPGLLAQVESLFGLSLSMSSKTGLNSHVGSSAASSLVGVGALAALGPAITVLQRVPAVLWMARGPEPLAMALERIEIE
jgi:protease-4